MSQHLRITVITALLSGLVSIMSQPVRAQTSEAGEIGTLEEIVVTARKREESILSVPTSISAIDGGQLEAKGVKNLEELARSVPGCRLPGTFLSRHWRPGATGALRLGIIHGAYCVGCCWMLMALLFIGGVMNIAWIAALSILVLIEKMLPGGRAVGVLIGAVLMGWGMATLWV